MGGGKAENREEAVSRRIIIKPQAESDMADAYNWYQQQQEGLGSRFLASVETAIIRITDGSDRFPIIHKKVRRALIQEFPYSVYFLVESDQIYVVTIVHQRRDPALWKQRTR